MKAKHVEMGKSGAAKLCPEGDVATSMLAAMIASGSVSTSPSQVLPGDEKWRG